MLILHKHGALSGGIRLYHDNCLATYTCLLTNFFIRGRVLISRASTTISSRDIGSYPPLCHSLSAEADGVLCRVLNYNTCRRLYSSARPHLFRNVRITSSAHWTTLIELTDADPYIDVGWGLVNADKLACMPGSSTGSAALLRFRDIEFCPL